MQQEILGLEHRLNLKLANLEKSLPHRIGVAVNTAVSKSEQVFHAQALKAMNEQVDLNKSFSNEALSKAFVQLKADIQTVKNASHNYLLSEAIKNISLNVEKLGREVSIVRSQLDNITSDKMIEIVETEDLKVLYSKSGASPDEMAKFCNCDKSNWYLILNGKESKPDLLRRHRVKQYFLKKILEAA